MECGALNGEKGSNSLFFERVRKWNGLLIEGDPSNYAELKKKNRKAFSINACLSPRKTAAKVPNYNVCWEMLYLFVVEYVVITVVPIVLGQWVPPTKDHPSYQAKFQMKGDSKIFFPARELGHLSRPLFHCRKGDIIRGILLYPYRNIDHVNSRT